MARRKSKQAEARGGSKNSTAGFSLCTFISATAEAGQVYSRERLPTRFFTRLDVRDARGILYVPNATSHALLLPGPHLHKRSEPKAATLPITGGKA